MFGTTSDPCPGSHHRPSASRPRVSVRRLPALLYDLSVERQGVSVVVRGVGDIGSAIAHRLFRDGYTVVLHDLPTPTTTRRGMAFADAVFDGHAALEGVHAVRA